MSRQIQWLIGMAIIVAGAVLFFFTRDSFLLRTGALIVSLGGMTIAVSARGSSSPRDGSNNEDARTAGPIFPQLGFVNKPIFWNSVCVLLIAVGVIGLATNLLPLEVAISALLGSASLLVWVLQRRGVKLPEAPSLVVWGVVAVLLVLFFYWRSKG